MDNGTTEATDEGDSDSASDGDGDGEEWATGDPLLAWMLASFHVATFVAVPILLLYAGDALGSLLDGVHTSVGLVLYLALWGITWRTNAAWLSAANLGSVRGTVVPGATWGAATGLGFFVVLLVVIGVRLREPVFLVILAFVGTPVAALVGAVVGAGFAMVDALVIAAGQRWAAETDERHDPPVRSN